jgi:FkbM family methyltransferase
MNAITKLLFYCRYPKQFFRRLKHLLPGHPYKHMEVEDFQHILPKQAVVLEAGASRGMDTVKFAALWPEGQIYAFEPEPATFAQLTKETERFPNVKCFPLALSTRSGSAVLNVSVRGDNANATDASSLLEPKEVKKLWDTLDFSNSVEVTTTTISAFMRDHEIRHVDLMWLDMQGMELQCLMASKEDLVKVDRIYMEEFLKPLYELAPLYTETKKAMRSMGFRATREFLNPIAGDVLFERVKR